jgi:hypothetical protein
MPLPRHGQSCRIRADRGEPMRGHSLNRAVVFLVCATGILAVVLVGPDRAGAWTFTQPRDTTAAVRMPPGLAMADNQPTPAPARDGQSIAPRAARSRRGIGRAPVTIVVVTLGAALLLVSGSRRSPDRKHGSPAGAAALPHVPPRHQPSGRARHCSPTPGRKPLRRPPVAAYGWLSGFAKPPVRL